MESNRIEKLLERYWNCETSLEEEHELRQYFQGEVPEHLKESAPLFRYYELNKKKAISDIGFDQKIMARLRPKGKMASLLRNSMRIAAGIAVVMVAFFIVKNEVRKSTPQEVVDTYDNPQLAYEETKKALLLISKSFGTAEAQAKKINLFNQATEEIEKKSENKNKTDNP
jgi:hypothetical protein